MNVLDKLLHQDLTLFKLIHRICYEMNLAHNLSESD